MKTLMVVSGGDAPGINAALARYTALATAQGHEVLGAVGGFAGALAGQIITLMPEQLAPFIPLAGSFLRTSREPVLAQPGGATALKDVLAAHGIDGIVLFGGDGSLRHIPPLLKTWDIPCVGLPTTIDNDVPGTELTLGHDSACNFAHQTIDGALATAHTLHGRIFMVETLGGDTGFLALRIAFAAGAHAVLVPEIRYDEEWLVQRLRGAVQREGYALLILSEGVKTARTLATTLTEQTGHRVRDSRLGHAQRGAAPSHRDRTLAAHMATNAAHALQHGLLAGTVVVRGGHPLLYEGLLVDSPPRNLDRRLYNIINGL